MKSGLVLLTVVCAVGSLQPTAVSDIVGKLDAYLAGYEPALSEYVADEMMMQEARLARSDLRRRDDTGVPVPIRQTRRLFSEVAFIALPDRAGWLGFRHVKTVDDHPVQDGASLAAALGTPGYEAARRLLAASAEHNLGLSRTINLPNLPLEFLHPRNRDRLVARMDGQERVRGIDTTRLLFTERVTPTVIRNPNGSDMPSVIRTWIDSSNGALMRAEVTTFESAEVRKVAARIRVEFARPRGLQVLVPTEMRETFEVASGSDGTGVATYSNFRKFQTSARIIPQ